MLSFVCRRVGLGQPGGGWIDPQAGTWHTWVLTSGSQFRPGPPPDEATTQAELEQLQAVADQRDTAALDQIEFWDTGAPSYRWNELSVSEALKHNLGANYATRALALVHVASVGCHGRHLGCQVRLPAPAAE